MANATLKNLRDYLIVNNPELIGNRDFPTPRLNKIINLACRFVDKQLSSLGMKKRETSIGLTASLSSFAYRNSTPNVKQVPVNNTTFPNMIESPKAIIQLQVSDGASHGTAKEVDVNSFDEFLDNGFLAPAIKEAVFMRLANIIDILPFSTTLATAQYYSVVPDLVSDSDITEIPLEFENHIYDTANTYVQEELKKITEADREAKLNAIKEVINQEYSKAIQKIQDQNINKQADKAKLQ